HAARQFWQSAANAGRDADLSAVSGGANRDHQAAGAGRARRDRGRRIARDARHDARDAGPMAFASGDAAHDYLSSLVLVEEPGAVGETQSLGRHAPGAGAIGPPDHRKATQIFHLERPSALDRIIFRTSPRGTFILRVSAPAPASRRSASVCAPIFAGKAVAKRTRRLRIVSAYSLPASIPRSAFSRHLSRTGSIRGASRSICAGASPTEASSSAGN